MVTAVASISASQIPENPSETEIDRYVTVYNNNTDQIPGFVGSIIGGQKINLNYEEQTYGVDMKNLKIEEVRKPFNKSTLDVWIDRKDVVDVANASSPKQELRDKLNNGEIKYEEKGIVNKVKFSILRLFI
jgi:hypothetical protein